MARAARQLNLSGVFAAAVTPTRSGTLDADYTGSLDLLDFLASGGVDGVCLLGSTGEFLNFTFAERQRLVYLGSKRTRVPLIVGVSHSTLAGAVRLGDEAIAAGADALLLMPPYFFRYAQPEVEAFYLEFAREVRDAVPLLLYNIPQFTTGIAVETAARLFASGRYAGIKDSSGDWQYFERLLELKRTQDFALLAGNDRIARRALTEGADGVVSGCACAIPELLSKMYSSVRSGDQAAANFEDARLQQFIDEIEKFPVPVGIKAAVTARKQKAGEPTVPLSPETAQSLEQFKYWVREWLETR